MSPTQWSKVQGLDQIILFGEKGIDNKLKFSLEPKGENAHKKKDLETKTETEDLVGVEED